MIHPGDFMKPKFTESKTGSFVLEWVVPESLPYFEGHFPNHPVLPATAIVDFSLEAIKEAAKNPSLEIKSLKLGKFYEIIGPRQYVEIRLTEKSAKEWEIAWFGVRPSEKRLAKLHFEFF